MKMTRIIVAAFIMAWMYGCNFGFSTDGKCFRGEDCNVVVGVSEIMEVSDSHTEDVGETSDDGVDAVCQTTSCGEIVDAMDTTADTNIEDVGIDTADSSDSAHEVADEEVEVDNPTPPDEGPPLDAVVADADTVPDDGQEIWSDDTNVTGIEDTAVEDTAVVDDDTGGSTDAEDTYVPPPPCEGVACDDGNLCTTDACTPETGICTNINNNFKCDDGNACTVGDVCFGGTCVAKAFTCDDGIVCTLDTCDTQVGCESTPLDQECDDNGMCTDDVCDASDGCVYAPNTAWCDDGEICTSEDICQGWQCIGGTNWCQCNESADCVKHEDSNLCNGTLVCSQNECVIDPATVVACDSSKDTDCLKAVCSPESGQCLMQANPNGTACDDNNACTINDGCVGGECVAGADVPNCDDNNPCTTDACDPNTGCANNTPNDMACNDGNACTNNDTCNASVCTAGKPAQCDDSNKCTNDTCDTTTGCVSATKNCDDADPCTTDACDVAIGCVYTTNDKACDDTNACTYDTCITGKGCVNIKLNNTCEDGDACTTGDLCQDGGCVAGKPMVCEDSNGCTTDTCDPTMGCVYTPNTTPCDDGDKCTTGDACQNKICTGGSGALVCDDGNVCTNEICASSSGCVYINTTGSCNDGNPCWYNDKCTNGSCKGIFWKNCVDGNPCTTDNICDPTASNGGCVYVPDDSLCDDGNPCTKDWCKDGYPGAPAYGGCQHDTIVPKPVGCP